MRRRTLFSALLVLAAVLLPPPGPVLSAEVPRMSVEELSARLDDGRTVVIDVRQQGDFEAGEEKIKGAVREDWSRPSKWAAKYDKEIPIVLYCA